ncbi:hypothetical protein KHP60_19870 [Microvirga sp. 3-52]|uniref:hypothetical protein n=1 Tax=Microvirga sp. 3-52 TaxID=2792425 RepID=UPI001AD09F34|nr:hypothetical protein [Microvirga sp. 3-52]MBO1909168.1 hypothetical protein [Microvirga sp. 3-52]MBS7454580.1 hypothetical protein [Microvirga sp. 3-52]
MRDFRTARMLEILRAAARTGRKSGGVAYTPSEAPAAGAALGGCLMRFVILAMFLLLVFFLMLSLVGGSLLQMFGGYYL